MFEGHKRAPRLKSFEDSHDYPSSGGVVLINFPTVFFNDYLSIFFAFPHEWMDEWMEGRLFFVKFYVFTPWLRVIMA